MQRNHGHSSFWLRLCGVWFTWIWQLLWIHPVDADRSDARLRARGPDVVSTTLGRSGCWFLLETADILASQTLSFEASTVLSTLLDRWLLDGNYHVLDVLVFLRHWKVIALPTPLGNFSVQVTSSHQNCISVLRASPAPRTAEGTQQAGIAW